MRLVGQLLENLDFVAARSRQMLDPMPDHARQYLRTNRTLPGADADPVVFVSGLSADRWMYRPGKEMLQNEGFMVAGMPMPWHGWAGIPGDGRALRETVERTIDAAQKSGRDVDHVQLVGDSEGGLISRWFLQMEGGDTLVSNLVTNGTPNGAIRPLGSELASQVVQRMPFMPHGVKDLLTSSPVMRDLNGDWANFLARVDDDFSAHGIASRWRGRRTDILVPERSARLRGAEPQVTNYVTTGAHSINFAFGRRQSEAGNVLLATLGSRDPAAVLAAERARDVARAAEHVQP